VAPDVVTGDCLSGKEILAGPYLPGGTQGYQRRDAHSLWAGLAVSAAPAELRAQLGAHVFYLLPFLRRQFPGPADDIHNLFDFLDLFNARDRHNVLEL